MVHSLSSLQFLHASVSVLHRTLYQVSVASYLNTNLIADVSLDFLILQYSTIFASMNKLPYTQRTLRADKVDVTLWEM